MTKKQSKQEKMDSRFEEIPIELIARDPKQPRTKLGEKSDIKRLLYSIKEFGLRTPIEVCKIEDERYIVIDGHRRLICAQELKFNTIPCQVSHKLNPGTLETLRYELQNNRRQWKPIERAQSLNRIKEAKKFTNKELAKYLCISETLIGNSLQLRNQQINVLQLIDRYKLKESHINEFTRLEPKLRKIRDLEVDDIIENIFKRVENGVIKNGKEFRTLGKIFLRASLNEDQLYNYLKNADMNIDELKQITDRSGFTLLIEQLIGIITTKMRNGQNLAHDEQKNLSPLYDVLKIALIKK